MGLLDLGIVQAGLEAGRSVLADQWKEYFYCESLPADVLVAKGVKRTGQKSANTKGSDNLISNGSVIAVADGQCMIIVEDGKVVEVCAQPGAFQYDTSTEPSIFCGGLGKGILNSFKEFGRRFTFGGDTGKDQRIYYFNIKEITDNKFGTPNPIPFRVVDSKIGLDVDVSVRCSGLYSYKIVDPILFYTNVCGNVSVNFTRKEIDNQLKTEFISALQPSFAYLSSLEIRPSAIPAHTTEIEEALNTNLDAKWGKLRGIEVISVALNPVVLPDEDAEMIKELQRTAVMRNPGMAAATLVGAQADAMKTAAGNENGAMMGFMGMNMAQMAGGMNANNLFAMAQEQQAATPAPATPQQSGGWTCSCGNTCQDMFCSKCGSKKPEQPAGGFCTKCGNKVDADAMFCSKCGNKIN